MRAVVVAQPGGPEVLSVSEVPDPVAGPGEVVVDVVAAGLNRADLLQRQGFYPPPPGASEIVGMECSGVISSLGPDVTGWQVGDEVCALLAGGGYASRVAVPAGQVMPVPSGVSLLQAAALPEVACTVWSNVWLLGGLAPGQRLLVHGGAGGIGSFALQLARALGIPSFTTASAGKLEFCRSLGARAIDYDAEDFVAVLQAEGGADVILDNMGAKYLARNLDALADGGRLVVIGLQGGTKAELDLNALMRKRGSVIGTTLRSRPVDGPNGKAAICASVVEHVWPLVASGQVRPVVDTVLPLEQVADAHRRLESGHSVGKVLLSMTADARPVGLGS